MASGKPGAVQRAFGAALKGNELHAEQEALCNEILRTVSDELGARLETTKADLSNVFGVTLFRPGPTEPIEIGPVRFLTKEVWFEGLITANFVDGITKRRVLARWAGRKLAKRKPSFSSMREDEILRVVANSDHVCVVETHHLGVQTAEHRAAMAARIALCAIALHWDMPSRVLNGLGLNYDPGFQRRHCLVIDDTRIRGISSSLFRRPDGPFLQDDWVDLWRASAWLRAPIAQALKLYTGASEDPPNKKILNALFHSLMWFHQGCLEQQPLIAAVKFAASMDPWAKGKGSDYIALFLNARLNIQKTDPLMSRGQTALEISNEVYGYVRNRTIHGNNERITEDWEGTRATAESLARLCIQLACDWIEKNPSEDEVELMWMPDKTADTSS
ncbi:hypothetical protein [Novosphingobium sp. JCM 18896]|uniref:hypothetical protein n=1 Tax=Novosphingobium sp. JCM 18896 TaxID=2989731 RepID=UPI002223E2CF|nr:hypothetical protein [Novosphingobium sp. JCM 18896]MCW1432526.1 hypothetical protein [Novosphingobium sp. JCM 18896]